MKSIAWVGMKFENLEGSISAVSRPIMGHKYIIKFQFNFILLSHSLRGLRAKVRRGRGPHDGQPILDPSVQRILRLVEVRFAQVPKSLFSLSVGKRPVLGRIDADSCNQPLIHKHYRDTILSHRTGLN